MREILERRWRAGIGLKRILIAGSGELGRLIADKILEHREPQTQFADITGSVISAANAQGADMVALATLDPVYPYVLEVSANISTQQFQLTVVDVGAMPIEHMLTGHFQLR